VTRCRGRLRRLVSERPGSPDSATQRVHFGALLSSRVRSRIPTATLARARSTGRCSPGLRSPLELAPAARGFGMRADERRSGRTRPHASSKSLGLATRIRQVMDPIVGSRTHDPPTSPVDRTGATSPSGSEPACERFRVPLTRRSPAPCSRFAREPRGPRTCPCPGRVTRAPSRRRPAPPALRPSAAAQGGRGGWTSETLRFSDCQSVAPSRGRPTLLGFCPSSNSLADSSGRDARLRRPSDFRPTSASPRGRALRHRNAAPPLLAPRFTLPAGGLSPVRPAP